MLKVCQVFLFSVLALNLFIACGENAVCETRSDCQVGYICASGVCQLDPRGVNRPTTEDTNSGQSIMGSENGVGSDSESDFQSEQPSEQETITEVEEAETSAEQVGIVCNDVVLELDVHNSLEHYERSIVRCEATGGVFTGEMVVESPVGPSDTWVAGSGIEFLALVPGEYHIRTSVSAVQVQTTVVANYRSDVDVLTIALTWDNPYSDWVTDYPSIRETQHGRCEIWGDGVGPDLDLFVATLDSETQLQPQFEVGELVVSANQREVVFTRDSGVGRFFCDVRRGRGVELVVIENPGKFDPGGFHRFKDYLVYVDYSRIPFDVYVNASISYFRGNDYVCDHNLDYLVRDGNNNRSNAVRRHYDLSENSVANCR